MRTALLMSSFALLACASPPTVDFVPLRPGVCEEGLVVCEGGRAPVAVTRELETPRTLVFVIDSLAIPVAMGGRAVGFDLDAMDSGAGSDEEGASCGERHADHVSSGAAGFGGVDNQLQSLVPTIEGLIDTSSCPGGVSEGCLDATIQRTFDGGRLIRLIEISGVDSFEHDDRVSVTVYGGRLPRRTDIVLGPDGRLAPDQRFDVDPDIAPTHAEGTLLAGRVDVSLDALYLPIDAGDFRLSLDLEQVRMRFDLAEARIAEGVVGGVTHVEPPLSDPGPDSTLCGVLQSVSDIDLEGGSCCVEPGACCNGVSVGLTFRAVRASLAEL